MADAPEDPGWTEPSGVVPEIGQLIPWFDRYLGPVLLIAIGVGILVHMARR